MISGSNVRVPSVEVGTVCVELYWCHAVTRVPLLQDCTVLPPYVITCPSPAASQSQQASVQFFINGVLYTGDSPVSYDTEEEEEEDGPHKGHFQLEYVEDPQFFTANKEKLIKHHPGEPLTLIINVSERLL